MVAMAVLMEPQLLPMVPILLHGLMYLMMVMDILEDGVMEEELMVVEAVMAAMEAQE